MSNLFEKDRKNFIVTIFGNKGYGKSYLVKHNFIMKLKNVIIFDVMNEYKNSKIIEIFDIETFVNFISKCYNKQIKYRCRLCFKNFDDYILALSVLKNFTNFTLILDEVYLLANTHNIDVNLNNFVNLGRHYAINLILMSRRPFQVNRVITSQTDLLICFMLRESRDLKFIEDYSSEMNSNKIKVLEKYKYTCYGNENLIEKFNLNPIYKETF